MLTVLIKLEIIVFSLIVLLFPLQLGKHYWPEFSYINGMRIDYLSPTLYITDILIFSLFTLFVIRILFFKKNILKKITVPSPSPFLLFAILCILISFGVTLSTGFLGIYAILKVCEYVFLGLYISYIGISRISSVRLSALLFIGIFFEVFLALFQFINQQSVGGLLYWFGERIFDSQTPGIANMSLQGELLLRPYGTFSHPNVLAGYLILTTCMIFLLLHKKQSIFLSLVYFVSFFGILLTFNRVGIIVWLIFTGILLFRNKIHYSSKFFLTSIIAIVCIAFVSIPLLERFTENIFSSESVQLRIVTYETSVSMITHNSLVGVGLYSYLPSVPLFSRENTSLYLQPVHNVFLLLLSELGIIGLFGVLYLFLKGVWQTILRNVGATYKFYIVSLLLLWVVLGITDHYLITLQQGQLVTTFVFGLCFSPFFRR